MSILDRFNLEGRAALVTGASRGIGRAIALGLAECGAAVAVHYAGREAAAREVSGRIARSCVVGGDLAEAGAAARVLAEAEAALGPVDVLVLNASVQHRRAWEDVSSEEFAEQVAVNLRSSLELMALAAPRMAERGWGRIVTVGSVQEVKPHGEMLTYGATKAALEHASRNVAARVAGRGVTVNHLSPGVIDTDRNADVLSTMRREVERRVPVGFIGLPEDCVGAALLLCSEAGRYITGATLRVDGGWAL